MEIITSLFAILLSTLSFGGIFINNYLSKKISQESADIGEIDIRINSVPTHQLLKGETDGIKLNLQQWKIRENIRIELLQLETDAIKLNLPKLRNLSKIKSEDWQEILDSPLNMGWRIILTEKDFNNIFLSQEVQSIIKKVSEDNPEIEIINLSLDFQPQNHIVVESKVKLPFRGKEELNVRLEFSLDLIKGHKFKIKDIKGTLNNRQLSSKLLQGFADNINTNSSLQLLLEKSGITLRLLQFDINEDNVALAGFIHLQSQSP